MPVVTLLNAVSANTTGTPAWLGVLYGNLTIGVSTAGTVSAFSVGLQGSNDGQNWASIGSAVTSTTAGESIGSGVLFQYFRATLSGYSGTGTVTCELACSLVPSASGGGGPPSGTAGGDLSGTYPNPTVAQIDGQALPVPVSLGGTGTATGAGQNDVFAGPSSGGAGAPSFRSLVSGDVPTLNQNTSGTAANLSGTPALPAGTTATTQTGGDSTTKLATTAFVQGAVPGAATTSTAGIVELDGTAADIAAAGTQSAGTGSLAPLSTHVHPENSGWIASDQTFKAWNYDIAMAGVPTFTSSPAAGTIYLARMQIRAPVTVSHIAIWWIAPSGGTPANSYLGLYSSAGAQVGTSSADFSATSSNVISESIGGSQNLSVGYYYVAFMIGTQGSTKGGAVATPMAGISAGTAAAGFGYLSASGYRWATNGAGASALPTGSSAFTLSSNAPIAYSFWCALL